MSDDDIQAVTAKLVALFRAHVPEGTHYTLILSRLVPAPAGFSGVGFGAASSADRRAVPAMLRMLADGLEAENRIATSAEKLQ